MYVTVDYHDRQVDSASQVGWADLNGILVDFISFLL
jgi:hypothetical protein